jgi:SUMO ligase MMS21 Smc5/6 complex component
MNRFNAPDADTPNDAPETTSRRKGRLSRAVTRLLNGEFLTREEVIDHIPFLLYVCCFFLLSIALGYSFDNTEREKIHVREQLKELNAEYKTLKTQLESEKQHSNVSQRILDLGLVEPTSAPHIIESSLTELEKQP